MTATTKFHCLQSHPARFFRNHPGHSPLQIAFIFLYICRLCFSLLVQQGMTRCQISQPSLHCLEAAPQSSNHRAARTRETTWNGAALPSFEGNSNKAWTTLAQVSGPPSLSASQKSRHTVLNWQEQLHRSSDRGHRSKRGSAQRFTSAPRSGFQTPPELTWQQEAMIRKGNLSPRVIHGQMRQQTTKRPLSVPAVPSSGHDLTGSYAAPSWLNAPAANSLPAPKFISKHA